MFSVYGGMLLNGEEAIEMREREQEMSGFFFMFLTAYSSREWLV